MCDQTFRKLHPEYNELMVETTKEAGFVSAKTAGAVRQTEQGVEQIAMDSVIYADDEAAIHGGTREELETMCTVIYSQGRHQEHDTVGTGKKPKVLRLCSTKRPSVDKR
jgi:hypothetical protein